MNSFMNYLKSADPSMYKQLSQYKPGSAEFDGIWKSIANHSGQKFEAVQHGFIKQTHYQPALNNIKKSIGLDISQYSPALQEALWSISVQHGVGGANNLFKNAGVKPGMSELDIIKKVYAERMKVDKYFSKSSASIKKSVYNRFQKELQDILGLYQTVMKSPPPNPSHMPYNGSTPAYQFR